MHSQRKVGLDILREKISFQRKTESLDWKKIASIDIENLIQEGDTTQLAELISCVTFCKADSEFDHDRIDPGFIKVFRISQLISECLLSSHEGCRERLTSIEEKHNESEKEKGKLLEEILQLKETLTSAKKELKKRKEMLASSQNEILGQNNSDEYDQCPYCTKRFLSSGYLLAHIQRRHQGLPVNPLYPSLPPGGTTAAAMLCHHHLIQSQTLPNQPSPLHQTQNNHQSLVADIGLHPESMALATRLEEVEKALKDLQAQRRIPPEDLGENEKDRNDNLPKINSSTQTIISNNDDADDLADDNDSDGEREKEGKSRKSEKDLVRPKTIMELEGNMADIPESMALAIRLEEVEKALKDLQAQRIVSPEDLGENEKDMKDNLPKINSFTQTIISNNDSEVDSADDSASDGERGKEGKSRKSQMAVVRPKTTMELERNMVDIGLNTESMALAIRLEEMEKAFKNLQAQQRISPEDLGENEKDRKDHLPKINSFTQTITSTNVSADDSVYDSDSYGERGKEGKPRKSQMGVVRPKTTTELEGNMADIVLNPESMALAMRLEEMDKALKNLQAQRIISPKDLRENEKDRKDNLPRRNSFTHTVISNNDSEDDSAADNDSDDEREKEGKSRRNQMDLIRAKRIMELERNMSDIELNPESTAIGLEEMGKALKNLRVQQRISSDDSEENENDRKDNLPKRNSFTQAMISNNHSEDDSTDDNDSDGERKKEGKSRKSQMDLVRAKTTMELERNMADIGLNPESTAIGLEEMGRALKHLKSQRRTSTGDQIHDQEKFELERNAVKSFANFEATKSTIDEKLDAISTLNRDKPQQNSFVRMFSAVKVSGKNLRKRVASAVKRRQKEHGSADSEDDENNAGGDAKDGKKRKRKTTSAPVLKTTFFSKARWTRKKKAEGTTTASSDNKASSKGNSGNKNDRDGSKTDSESGAFSEEDSGEDIVAPPFMTRSKPVLPRRNSSSKSFERKSRNRKSSSDSESVKGGSRSRSHSKLNKPLKRLNSSANSNSSQNSSPSTSAPRQNMTPQKKEDYLNVINYKKDDEQSSHSSEIDNSEDDRMDDERYKQVMKKSQLSLDRDRHRSATRRRDSSESSPFSNVDEYEGPTKDTDDDDDEKNYESNEELSRGRTTSRTHHHPVIASGHFETVQVKPVAQARVIPVVDKVVDSDEELEGDINALLNVTMSDDDKRLGYQHNQQQQPRPSSPIGSGFNRRSVGASLIQPTQHGGLQRSNLTGIPRERGGIRSTQLTVHSRGDVVSPSNSWDSWNSPKK